MFVVGTDATGLEHPNWRENLKLAITLQQKLNEKYPGITRPIYISYNRYNQHLTPGSLIVEVGGDGNTIDECLESTKYLAEVINEVINNK
jgi:stage II sporulation protein P